MKKIAFVLALGVISLGLVGCGVTKLSSDEVKFKEEYEELNGVKREKDDKENLSITVLDDNNIQYVSSKEAINILENKTGVIYFGFPDCPWCRNMVPILIDAAKTAKVDKIYYANLLEERDIKEKKNDEIITTKKGSDNYYKVLDLLGDKAETYDGLEDNSIKRLYFPTVVFVKNGKISGVHVGTVDSQKNPYIELSDKEQNKLKNIFMSEMTKIQTLSCDTDKSC